MSNLRNTEVWHVPQTAVTLADGTVLIRQGKPVLRATGTRTARLTGLSRKQLAILAEAGFIREERPTPGTKWYYPGEVMAFVHETGQDPGYWTEGRVARYLRHSRARDGRWGQAEG